MQQPCSRCGYVSDRPARFCRQCGAPLFSETETTSAATRNYGPSPASQPYADPRNTSDTSNASGASGGGYEDPVAETTRFYRPPMAPNYQSYPTEPPKKSRAGMWVLIAVLSLLFVGGGMVGLVSLALRSRPPITKNVEDEVRRRVEEELERAKEQIAQAQEEAERAKEEAGDIAPPPPPAPPAPNKELEQYKYPGATVDGTVRFMGNEVLNLRTRDGFEKVKEFYVKAIGRPFVESNEGGEEKLVFQSSGLPSVIVSIEPDKKHPGERKITILRMGFQLPKYN
ncbi:MAG: hypothetical protein ACREEM_44730 [Blastocatellia bacterium]